MTRNSMEKVKESVMVVFCETDKGFEEHSLVEPILMVEIQRFR